MKKFFETKFGGLIFSLISGLAYYVIIMRIVVENTGNNRAIVLGIVFFPAIVAGMAYVLLKNIKKWQEENAYNKIYAVAVFHILLIIFGIVFLAAWILGTV